MDLDKKEVIEHFEQILFLAFYRGYCTAKGWKRPNSLTDEQGFEIADMFEKWYPITKNKKGGK